MEIEYSPSKFALRPLDEYVRDYRVRSAPFVGSAELCRPGRPLVVYIHGGYWQELSAAESLFNAPDAVSLGVGLHAVEYPLAPGATIDHMVEVCIGSIEDAVARMRPSHLVLAGSSAGAHLAAMCARDPQVAQLVDTLVLLSGIYDLQPLVETYVNDALGLTPESARALSPQFMSFRTCTARTLCAVGGHESAEFKRQTAEFAEKLVSDGVDAAAVVVEERDHFDLPYDLLRPATVVGDWTISRMKGTGS